MKRQVIEIDEEKCVGCGKCASACMQGAIQMVNGKAKLMSESYCDGLGMCLPECPVDAIHLTEKETEKFDEKRKGIKAKVQPQNTQPLACGCPGTSAKKIERKPGGQVQHVMTRVSAENSQKMTSELMQWPVQIRLVNPNAPYFEKAHLLVAADCTAFAYAGFHQDFIKGKITVIGCPKLDDQASNLEKLKAIIEANDIQSITAVRMEVPCCTGIVQVVKQAMLEVGKIVPYQEVTLSTSGERL